MVPVVSHEGDVPVKMIFKSADFPIHGLKDFVQLRDQGSKQASSYDEEKKAKYLDEERIKNLKRLLSGTEGTREQPARNHLRRRYPLIDHTNPKFSIFHFSGLDSNRIPAEFPGTLTKSHCHEYREDKIEAHELRISPVCQQPSTFRYPRH